MPAIVNSNNVFLGSNGGGGVNYTAGKYIDISENIISVSGLEPYSAGQNIDITDNVISSKNWTTDINNASSYAYEQATAHGVEYSGIAPIDVNNTTHEISADVWTLSGTSGIEILEDAENKVTTLRVSGDYAKSSDLNAYVPLSGITDTTEHSLAKLGTYNLYFSSEYSNTIGIGGYSNYSIDNCVYSANVQGYAAHLYLSPDDLYLYKSSAYGSAESGSVDLKRNGLELRSVNGNAYIGPNNSDLINVYTSGNNSTSFISFNRGYGPSYSSENTAIGRFYVETWSDMSVPRSNPVWVVKNGSGDGFSIGACEAKGFDKDGNTIWSTKLSKATQLLHGGTDPNPAILITPLQTTTAYSGQWSSAPYVSADYNSLTISYGPTASVPNIKVMPDGITTQILTANSARAQFGLYAAGVKFENSAGTWSLTGSVQKREIEGDTATSAITAIAGSAIGGVGGETIDLSAGEGISIVETGDKVLISNNISAGSNMSFVYDSETNKIRIDANDAFPITATDGNTTWSADCKASAFTMGRNTSRTDIGAFGFEYRQAPSVNVSGSWYDLALLMEKFKYAIPVEAVANSGMATGQNILYVVTGS